MGQTSASIKNEVTGRDHPVNDATGHPHCWMNMSCDRNSLMHLGQAGNGVVVVDMNVVAHSGQSIRPTFTVVSIAFRIIRLHDFPLSGTVESTKAIKILASVQPSLRLAHLQL